MLVLEFLTKLFEEGASYGTLNSTRSAIALIVQEKIGQNDIISRFMRGAFKQRPTKAKYDRVWDVQGVLDELSKMYPLEGLTLIQLTEKTVTLLAIATAQRAQTLSLIKVKNVKSVGSGYEIKVPDFIKTSRPGAFQPLLQIPRFDENPKCCPARTLEHYLKITKNLRGNTKELFISTKAYRKVTVATISRWIRCTLHKCGVDESFTAHSTRHASSSAAAKKGLDVRIINSTVGWSERSQMFARVYNRPIENKNKFGSVVLSKS